MKIKTMIIKNFKGIESLEIEMPHIAAICGKNGIGKTSLLDALRFALTGEEPEGEMIRYGAAAAIVTAVFENGKGDTLEISRKKETGKPSKFYVEGKATTQKSLNETLQTFIGLPLDKIKILASSEMVGAMKPQEFSSLILEYIPEKMTLEKVMDFIPAATAGMIDIIDANLPAEGIDLETLDEFDSVARATRKELKSSLQAKKLIYDKHIKEKPAGDRTEVEEKIRALNNKDAEYKIYLEKVNACKAILDSKKGMIERVAALRKQAEEIKVSRPDPAVLAGIKTEERELQERLLSQNTALNGVRTAIATLESTLGMIENSMCPISPMIVCKTDKSVAREDIKSSLEATVSSQHAIEEEIAFIEGKLKECRDKADAETSAQRMYEEKLNLMKQAKQMEDSMPADPVMPEPVEKTDTGAEMFKLNALLENIRNYEEGLRIKADIDYLEVQVEDYEAIVKLLAEKGPVRAGVVSSYLGIFQDLCNTRSAAICPDFSFEFVADNGVVVYMCNKKTGTKLAYNELSGGEKAYMLFILIDMLNQLVGARILLLDELSVMDESTFNTLLKLVMQNAGDYDHVILSAVNYKEIVEGFKANEIDFLSI